MKWTRMVGLLVVAALVALAAAGSAPPSRAQVKPPVAMSAVPAGIHKIRHVVIIMQENHSFDNYFGTYPGAVGIPGLAGHAGSVPCIPDPHEHCMRPYHNLHDLSPGGPHTSPNAFADINHGKMDGFILQEEKAWKLCHCGSPNDGVMGYHTGKELPNYWTYAHDFVLQDHMFQSDLSWSLPSHLYLVSEWSAFCAKKGDPASCRSAIDHPGNPPGWGPHPSPKPPNYAWTDLTYLLHKHHVSWRYYIFKGIEPDCESDTSLVCTPVTQGPRTMSDWNPLLYFDTVRNDHQLSNIQSVNGLFNDLRNNTLPAVSWIVPSSQVSEHAPGLISKGQTYVTGLINTIMQSKVWDSTAIFLAWDDWSGFYDNVPPPHVDVNGYGLRVPALVISPYVKRGYVDHQVLSFDAYAKFIEDVFLAGQRLNPRTDGRPDPRPDVREKASILGNLINDFNFNQAPLKPVLLPVHPKTDFVIP